MKPWLIDFGFSAFREYGIFINQMKWFKDVRGRQVRLTDERQEHIETDHPEMSGQIDKIQETLSNPD